MSKEKIYFFDKKENIQRVLYVFYALCILLLGGDLVIHRHEMHPWDTLLGFYPLFGFVACVALVLVAKEMRRWLMRDEDYYEKESGDDAA